MKVAPEDVAAGCSRRAREGAFEFHEALVGEVINVRNAQNHAALYAMAGSKALPGVGGDADLETRAQAGAAASRKTSRRMWFLEAPELHDLALGRAVGIEV